MLNALAPALGVAMDPQLQTLAAQLADTAIRNTAGSIADRITAAKARKKDQETIVELEEIVYGLLSDKSELVQIAQAYEQELVAQRISKADIEYISTNFVPLLQRLIRSTAASNDQDGAVAQEMIDIIQPLISVETVTVLQLIGFNFRKAIGEPLTEFVSKLILSKAQVDPALPLEIQRAYLDIAQNPEAHARLANMLGAQQ
jgi:hypothetical protein